MLRRKLVIAEIRWRQISGVSEVLQCIYPDITDVFSELIKGIRRMIDEGYSVIPQIIDKLDIEQDHSITWEDLFGRCNYLTVHPGQTSHIGRNTICSSTNSDLYLEYDTVGNDSKEGCMRLSIVQPPPSNCIVGWRFNDSVILAPRSFCEFYRSKGMTIRQIFWSLDTA